MGGTTSSVWYEAINVSNGQTYPTYGMEIRCDTSNSKNYIYIDSDDNTSHPNQVSVKPPNGTHGALASFVEVEVGDEVKFYKSVAEGSTLQQTWTVDAGRLFTFSSGSGGNNPGPLSNNPKIENIVITKSSDTSLTVSFDWENLDSFTLTNSRGGVVQTGNGGLSGSSGTVNTTFLPSISCQEGDLCWVHGMYSNNTLEHHPSEYGSQSNPYLFKVVNFSTLGTALTLSTFLAGATSLNNDADLRVWDFSVDSWSRYGYINYDGTLQTVTIDPFERGKAYYVVDRSTGNDYGTRYTTPGGRKTRGRTFW